MDKNPKNLGFSFIETQFPVSKLSKESYTERKANTGQTLTGLGKWWGRKPLILCRATILGLLLPATNNPATDRDIFLRLMTMDDGGMLRRKSTNIKASKIFESLAPSVRNRFFEPQSTSEKTIYRRNISPEDKDELQERVFLSLSYDERLQYCCRPEEVEGPSPESWQIINNHLGTKATSIVEFVQEVGRSRFGHIPSVGDSFCGGGSIPFEAARLGCNAYGSDLNPVASLLTWASLNIVGGGKWAVEEVSKAQKEVFDAVDRQVTEWGIERREPDPNTGRHWRADAYLSCLEATCPECGWRVPLAPSWVIGRGTQTVAILKPNELLSRYEIEINQDSSQSEMLAADAGTVKDSELVCPHCKNKTPIKTIRGDGRGTFGDSKSLLRGWENRDVVQREGDIFGERLYCIRWVDDWIDDRDKKHHERHYRAPTDKDLERETKVLNLLMERFDDWQVKGFIPSRKIEPGYNTTQPIRERGWTYWHHLFNPRQLLILGLFLEETEKRGYSDVARIGCLLGLLKSADNNSRLSAWSPLVGKELVDHVFTNQALNTVLNPGTRALNALRTCWFFKLHESQCGGQSHVLSNDARTVPRVADIWLTDPPYADAVNYEEISEFFLAWSGETMHEVFHNWKIDSRRALAVKGNDDNFRMAMVQCYRKLADNMPDNGLQVVMFTHQDAAVWADLALILWAAGLRVTAAWCISTETDSALKEGNYVQGTVLLVLRKQVTPEACFLDDVYPQVEAEVRHQLDSMLNLDDIHDPNFADTDYQLAAYAAALRVLTSKKIEEINVAYELTRVREKGEVSPVEQIIRTAVGIACDHLVPRGIGKYLWKSLTPVERFYIKGLEMESYGECRIGVYQEMAKGFRVPEYKPLLANAKANEARLRTASDFGHKDLSGDGFASTMLRQALFGILLTIESENTHEAIVWFATEIKDYVAQRANLIEILDWLGALGGNASMGHWCEDAAAACLLAGALRNRQDNV